MTASPRKVVYYVDGVAFGGTEQVVLQLLTGLDRRRWTPVLMYHPELGLTPLLDGARRCGVDLRPVPRAYKTHALRRLPHWVRELWSEEPTVFHAHLNHPISCRHGLIAASLARIPAVVATVHLIPDLPASRSLALQQRLVATGVDRYLTVSHHVARRLTDLWPFLAAKTRVVHNGVRLGPPPQPAELSTHPTILTIARLDEQKGIRYLLEAAANLPQARFVLAGDGPDRKRLEDRSRDLGIADRTTFLGYRDDVSDLLARCDLFVLPSLNEGLPLSVLEAMAAGKPIVATRVGGTPEAVADGETALLVPPASASALSAAIQTLLADPALANRLGTAARARAEHAFSVERMVEQTTATYDELLSGRRDRHERS